MSKAMDLEYPTFSLETVDRKNDEKAQSRQVKKPDRLVSALGLGSSGGPKTPMDSDYQDELEEAAPKIRFNLNFDK